MVEPRIITAPQPGYWAVRLVRGGPEVPACILRLQTRLEPGTADNVMDRSPHLVGFLAGEQVTPDEVWIRRGRPIDAAEYQYLVDAMTWDKEHAPRSPLANPHRPIDLSRERPVLPPGVKW